LVAALPAHPPFPHPRLIARFVCDFIKNFTFCPSKALRASRTVVV
jgi:hypothetical protein